MHHAAAKYKVAIRELDVDGNSSEILKEVDFESEYKSTGVLDSQSFKISPPGGRAGVKYLIQVTAISENGSESDQAETICWLKPETPKSIVVDNLSKSSVKIRWSPVPGAISYNILFY